MHQGGASAELTSLRHLWSRARSLVACTVTMIVCLAALTGCSLSIPADPEGSLDHARGGTLRVGASPDGVTLLDEGGDVVGSQADLVRDFAQTIDARVEWTMGGEEQLVNMLEQGRLDMAVGGMTDETPWVDRAGVTRPYTRIAGAEGDARVMFVPLGENDLLSTLERFLDEEVGG